MCATFTFIVSDIDDDDDDASLQRITKPSGVNIDTYKLRCRTGRKLPFASCELTLVTSISSVSKGRLSKRGPPTATASFWLPAVQVHSKHAFIRFSSVQSKRLIQRILHRISRPLGSSRGGRCCSKSSNECFTTQTCCVSALIRPPT